MLVGVIHRIEHAVHAKHLLREFNGRLPSHATVGDVEIFAQVIAGLFLQRLHAVIALGRDRGAVHVVKTVKPKRQGLAHVPQDHSEFGKAVEYARGDDAQGVQAGLYAKAIDCAVKASFLERLDHVFRQRIGVQVNRCVVRFGGGKNIPKLRV